VSLASTLPSTSITDPGCLVLIVDHVVFQPIYSVMASTKYMVFMVDGTVVLQPIYSTRSKHDDVLMFAILLSFPMAMMYNFWV
jgi:hypothetical protein